MKILTWIIAAIVVLVAVVFSYFYIMLPSVSPAPQITIEATPERLERGKYLAEHVAGCIDCHSTRDWSKFAGPLVEGTEGKGGFEFNEEMGFPGLLVSSNITPAALGDWSDGEILRAITSGVSKDGKVLFPLMPYTSLNKLSKEDAYSIVAYIRTLQPVQTNHPQTDIAFPVSMFIRSAPQDYTPAPEPDTSNSVEYGKYLATIAGCQGCHTPMDKGQPIEGMEFAGGEEFKLPGFGIVRSANITPHEETGIGYWDKEIFVDKFKYYGDSTHVHQEVKENEFQTVMAWHDYAGMKTKDLEAVYDYLRTLKPIPNATERFTLIQ